MLFVVRFSMPRLPKLICSSYAKGVGGGLLWRAVSLTQCLFSPPISSVRLFCQILRFKCHDHTFYNLHAMEFSNVFWNEKEKKYNSERSHSLPKSLAEVALEGHCHSRWWCWPISIAWLMPWNSGAHSSIICTHGAEALSLLSFLGFLIVNFMACLQYEFLLFFLLF